MAYPHGHGARGKFLACRRREAKNLLLESMKLDGFEKAVKKTVLLPCSSPSWPAYGTLESWSSHRHPGIPSSEPASGH